MIDDLIANFEADVTTLMTMLQNGRVTPNQWQDAMQRLLARYHSAGMMSGLGSSTLPPEAVELLKINLTEGQFPYLRNFTTLIKASPEYNPAWLARALLYARSPKTSYWEGRVAREAGQFLPLPAMPAQGTQCHTNCGCGWKIEKLEGDGNFNAYWKRHKDDSCQTCLQREADWQPFKIRDGVAIGGS